MRARPGSRFNGLMPFSRVFVILFSNVPAGDMVQFHALALLRSIKKHDKLAVSKARRPYTPSP